jgi:hypothetical protein
MDIQYKSSPNAKHLRITVKDSGGSIVEGKITYTSVNSLRITFTGAFSGNAYLS